MPDIPIRAVVTADDKASGKLKDFSEKVEDVGKNMKKVALGLAAVGAGVTLYAKNAIDSTVGFGREVKKLSREIGENEVETSKLLAVGKKLGLSAEEASTTFGIFSKKIQESREATGETALAQEDLRNKIEKTNAKIVEANAEIKKNGDKSGDLRREIQGLNVDLKQYQAKLDEAISPLHKLGIETKKADGSLKGFNDILFEVADKFKTMPNGVEKTAAVMELFGRSGKDMLPLLNKGAEGIKEMAKQAEALGLTLTPENIGKLDAYTQAQKRLADSSGALSMQVGLAAAPAMTKFNESVNGVLLKLLETEGPMRNLTIGFLAFSGPVFGATAAVIGFVANLATAAPMIQGVVAAIGAASPALFLVAAIASAAALGYIIGHQLIPALAELKGHLDSRNAQLNAVRYNVEATTREIERAVDRGDKAAARASAARLYVQQQAAANQHTNVRTFPGNAEGTDYWRGGMTWVGERGPELVSLPTGSKVIPNHAVGQTLKQNTSVNVSMSGVFMGTPSEGRKIAQMIADHLRDIAGQKNMSVAEMLK